MPEFDRKLLEMKKKRFLDGVAAASKAIGHHPPEVNFDGCPGEDENQLAHYHPGLYRICVSKRQLYKLNFDDIWDVASHEVAHVLEHGHDTAFVEVHQNIKQKNWKKDIPRGIPIIREGAKEQVALTRERHGANECTYHLCHSDSERNCGYCYEPFCIEHICPKQVLTRSKIEDAPRFLQDNWNDEFRKREGHSCGAYEDYLREKKRSDEIAYSNAFDSLLDKKKHRYKTKEPNYRHVEEPLGMRIKNEDIVLIIGILIVLFVLLVVLRITK